jgi:hypothetical protein
MISAQVVAAAVYGAGSIPASLLDFEEAIPLLDAAVTTTNQPN